LNPEIYDKYKEIDTRTADKYRIAFICVDTPATEENLCDTTEVKNAIMENDALIYVVKSTVLPETTERLMRETGKHILFSPEYYGCTQHCNNFSFPFTILGGEKEDCKEVIQYLQHVYDGRHQFRITDSKTAELAKYMENSFLAMKTSFCQQFFDIAERAGVCYEELRELFTLDPRVGPSHTFVYRDHPYWDSHCLNKDVPAIANAYGAELLLSMIEFNEKRKHPVSEEKENA
jgi:UDP-glucose 6-dehydrogenase